MFFSFKTRRGQLQNNLFPLLYFSFLLRFAPRTQARFLNYNVCTSCKEETENLFLKKKFWKKKHFFDDCENVIAVEIINNALMNLQASMHMFVGKNSKNIQDKNVNFFLLDNILLKSFNEIFKKNIKTMQYKARITIKKISFIFFDYNSCLIDTSIFTKYLNSKLKIKFRGYENLNS